MAAATASRWLLMQQKLFFLLDKIEQTRTPRLTLACGYVSCECFFIGILSVKFTVSTFSDVAIEVTLDKTPVVAAAGMQM